MCNIPGIGFRAVDQGLRAVNQGLRAVDQGLRAVDQGLREIYQAHCVVASEAGCFTYAVNRLAVGGCK